MSPETRGPELPAPREPDKAFGRGAVLFPVLLIGWADAAQVHRKGRIPIVQILGGGDSGIVRDETAVRGESRDRHDLRDTELGSRRVEQAFGLPDIEFQRDRVAGLRGQLTRGPFVERDAILSRRRGRPIQRRHYRIGNLARPVAHTVGEIGEHGLHSRIERLCRGGDRVGYQTALAVKDAVAQSQAQILKPVIAFQIWTRPRQNRVHAIRLAEIVLEAYERHVHRAHIALLGTQREFVWTHGAHSEPDRLAGVFLASMERLEWDRGRSGHAQ